MMSTKAIPHRPSATFPTGMKERQTDPESHTGVLEGVTDLMVS